MLECPAPQASSPHAACILGLLDRVGRRSLGLWLGDPSALWAEPRRDCLSLCQPRTDGALLSIYQTQSGFQHREAPSPTHSGLQGHACVHCMCWLESPVHSLILVSTFRKEVALRLQVGPQGQLDLLSCSFLPGRNRLPEVRQQ